MSRSIASLSLDLDNKWAYLRAAGCPDWRDRPSYLPMAVDRIVEMPIEKPTKPMFGGRNLDILYCTSIGMGVDSADGLDGNLFAFLLATSSSVNERLSFLDGVVAKLSLVI